MDADKLTGSQPLEYVAHRLAEHVPASRGVDHDVCTVGFDPADIPHVDSSPTEPAAEQNPLCAWAVERPSNSVERRPESRLRHGFNDVITRSDIECPRGKLRVRRYEDDVFHEGANDILYLESVEVRHSNVEKDDVRANLAHSCRNVAGIGTFADDIEIGSIMKQLAQALPREFFVVDNENPMGTGRHAVPASSAGS